MSEAAAAAPVAAPAAPAAPSTAGAGTTLTSVPAGDSFYSGFKNEEIKSYVAQKGFKTTEDLATSYKNLESKLGISEDRLLRLPDKLEGADVRPIFEKLGAPKEAKEYALPRDEKLKDHTFTDWAEGAFHQHNLTKAQAHGVISSYNEFVQKFIQAENEQVGLKIKQADENLKKEWGTNYEQNLNLAKQGARVLGLEATTLDLIEKSQGRESLFKALQKIGVGVGESSFVAGGTPQNTAMTPEQAQTEIKQLMGDRKFIKAINRGDKEATDRWNALNKAAAPGEKSIG